MKPLSQAIGLTVGAALLYAGLRNMPDTHCSFLHASHEPVIIEGAAFCGEDEEANFYDPAALGFPFKFEVRLADNQLGGELRILDEAKRPVPPHLFAISHTQPLHLHLRQGDRYLHLHPTAQADGTWTFLLPERDAEGFLSGPISAYADFVHVRSLRTILVSDQITAPLITPPPALKPPSVVARWVDPQPLLAGQSVMLRVRLSRTTSGHPVLRPLMGALGHAVLFSTDGKPGYAHIHPSFTGRERTPEPELAFRLRLPAAGAYDLFVHIDDEGQEVYARLPLVVLPSE